MKSILEVRPSRLREPAHGASGNLKCVLKAARVLMRLDCQIVGIRVIRSQLQRTPRGLSGILEIASLAVLHRHHLQEPSILRVQLQGGSPGTQRIVTALKSLVGGPEQIVGIEVARRNLRRPGEKRNGITELLARLVEQTEIEQRGKVSRRDADGLPPEPFGFLGPPGLDRLLGRLRKCRRVLSIEKNREQRRDACDRHLRNLALAFFVSSRLCGELFSPHSPRTHKDTKNPY